MIRIKENISDSQWKICIVLFYFFVYRDVLESYIGFLGYIDELLALCAIPIFIVHLRKLTLHKKGGAMYVWLLVFVFVGLLGNLKYGYQPFLTAVLPDVIVNLKFWMALYVGQQIYYNFDIEEYGCRLFRHIKLLTWFFSALIIADYFFNLFSTDIRYGLRSTCLFYSHYTVFAGVSVFVIAVLLSIMDYIGKKANMYFLWWLILLASTLRSKALGAAAAFAFIFYYSYIRKKKLKFQTALLLMPFLVLIAWNQIEWYFFSYIQDDSARYQLMAKAFTVANDHFPLGSGFGTFASHFSAEIYSPLYQMYGLTKVNGLVKGHAHFVSDVFWPMILGQTGYVGLVAFAAVVWELYKKIQRVYRRSKADYVSGICILTYILICSTAESAFVHPLMTPMALWLGYILRQKQENFK